VRAKFAVEQFRARVVPNNAKTLSRSSAAASSNGVAGSSPVIVTGGSINTLNERHVRDLLMAMRELDRGTARENRALLLAPLRDGDVTVDDLLRSRHFGDAVTLVGRGRRRATPSVPREALWKPEKLSVADMLGTSADRIHTDEGRALPPRRGPRRGVRKDRGE
jgi:hypothetical protein